MEKDVLVLIVFGFIFGIFLIGGVSADVNFAFGGTPIVTYLGGDRSTGGGIIPYTSNPGRINDGLTTDWQGVEGYGGSTTYGSSVYFTYEAIVTFPSTEINKVEYVRDGSSPGGYNPEYERVYLYYNNQWNLINDEVFYEGPMATNTITSGGPWTDITRVRVLIYTHATDHPEGVSATSHLYELEAWGPDAFFCGDDDCNLGETCGDTDIAPECNSDCGVCPEINTCSSPDDIIMKLFSSDNSHGALWYFALGGVGFFGNQNVGTDVSSALRILGGVYTAPQDGTISDITISVSNDWISGGRVKCAVYDQNRDFIAETEERSSGGSGWQKFDFASPVPVSTGLDYSLVCWADSDIDINSESDSPATNYFQATSYGAWPASLGIGESVWEKSIYASYSGSSSYGYEICYNDSFGSFYTGDLLTVHDCVGTTNKVLGLSDISDAFGETPETGVYTNEVCYGDLECESITSGSCSDLGADYKTVLSLQSSTGSLISAGDFAGYSTKICCRQETTPTGDVYWADMNGNPTTSAEIGDSVKLVVDVAGPGGQDVSFTIKEKETLLGVDFFWPDSVVDVSSGIGFTKWQTSVEGDYYFIADVEGTEYDSSNIEYLNGILTISDTESNSPPTTQIINPVAETNYVIRNGEIDTNLIDFEQISSDIDDDLAITWKFGDGESASFDNCLSGTNCDTTHQYTTAGTKNIILKAQEMNRNTAPVKDNSRIYVYKEGLVAYVVINQIVTGRLVEIDATQTKISDCYYLQATCEGARATSGVGGSCYEVTDTIDLLESVWCYDKTLRIDGIDSNPNLFLDWTSDGVAFTPTQVPGERRYIKIFDEPGDHIINLNVRYNTLNP